MTTTAVRDVRRYDSALFHPATFVPSCMIFLAGICIGLFYGTLSDDVVIVTSGPPFENNIRANQNNGWQTIDVFYGSTDHATSLLPQDQKWFSQARQDEVVLSLLQNKKDGFFVDLAANDATTLSNTYSLERDFGWNGLCIEPNPMYWYNLTHFRPNCQLVGAVVGQRRSEEVSFRYNAADHGGIAGQGFDNGPKFKKESLPAYTVPLLEIFERYHVPKVIDYLSLDVEGAEEFIMRGFPLHAYRVRLLTVERPKDGLKELLEAHGYQQIQRLSRWGESLWTHKDVYSELDTSKLDDFNGKNQFLAEKALKEGEVKSE